MKVETIQLKSFSEGHVSNPSRGARAFVAHTKQAPPEAPPPPPTFSEEELKAAERDGYQKGFLEGVKEGNQQARLEQLQIDKQIAAMATKFEGSIVPIFEHYKKFTLQLNAEMPKIAYAIAKKVAGEALHENAHQLIADIATRACETMNHEAKLTIIAHDSLGDKLEQMLQGLAARLPENTEIIILRDPDMPLADCRIDWKHGNMEHCIQTVWEKIEKAVVNLSATSLRDGSESIATLEKNIQINTPSLENDKAQTAETPTPPNQPLEEKE